MFIPQPLRSKTLPFDHSDYVFELKYDGFRALAYLENGRCRLVSRNGTTFSSFSFLASSLVPRCRLARAVLDGEIVCLDSDGYPQFNDCSSIGLSRASSPSISCPATEEICAKRPR